MSMSIFLTPNDQSASAVVAAVFGGAGPALNRRCAR
jgi:hypothetical protein